jgi:hypothetical protein
VVAQPAKSTVMTAVGLGRMASGMFAIVPPTMVLVTGSAIHVGAGAVASAEQATLKAFPETVTDPVGSEYIVNTVDSPGTTEKFWLLVVVAPRTETWMHRTSGGVVAIAKRATPVSCVRSLDPESPSAVALQPAANAPSRPNSQIVFLDVIVFFLDSLAGTLVGK